MGYYKYSALHSTSGPYGGKKTGRQALFGAFFKKLNKNFGAIAEYPVQIEAGGGGGGGKGLASTRQVSSVAGSLNEAISYVLATRLRVATRQN